MNLSKDVAHWYDKGNLCFKDNFPYLLTHSKQIKLCNNIIKCYLFSWICIQCFPQYYYCNHGGNSLHRDYVHFIQLDIKRELFHLNTMARTTVCPNRPQRHNAKLLKLPQSDLKRVECWSFLGCCGGCMEAMILLA